jgi:hypothetical protein
MGKEAEIGAGAGGNRWKQEKVRENREGEEEQRRNWMGKEAEI